MAKEPGTSKLDAATYLAAERTLLAWIRTGLALMGFGFVVARFGLFVRELAAIHEPISPIHTGFSVWIGTTLVVIGVAVNLLAALRHASLVAAMACDESATGRLRILGIGLPIVL